MDNDKVDDNLNEKLERLAKMFVDGLITRQEYEDNKDYLVDKPRTERRLP
jgi:hypothetical protein